MTMTLAGHTLGTPGLTPPEAVRLFRAAGIDAIEIIWQDGYLSGLPESDGGAALAEVNREASEQGVTVCCLTPYMVNLNSLDDGERERDLLRFRRCIEDAERLGAHRIRTYAGTFRPDQVAERQARWRQLVASLAELAPFAAARGVALVVENHFSTMTVTAREARELMNCVDHQGVGILYDQANLTFTHSEDPPVAVEVQRGWIRHVHVKDLIFTDPGKPFAASEVAVVAEEERSVRSRVVGDGILDWLDILTRLDDQGYDGYLSLEYEYRWHPDDLPDPAEGFRRSADYLRAVAPEIVR
ncbi:MAG: sugar phosphate isomerase/epimerase family protein [Candidatus Dormibacteria bacterium]